MSLPSNLPSEELINLLAAAEVDTARPPDATVQNLQQELHDLQDQVRQPEPHEPYVHEPEGHRAVESIAALSSATSPAGRTSPAQEVQPPPDTLGQYELLKLLGQGGMGAVYKARHTRLDKIVALKVLPGGKLKAPQAVSRFEREMRAVGKLQHPNIVAAHDAGEIGGTHYLVMELVDGVDLGALVKQHGPLPVSDACELIRQAALGLQHAHEHGLVHRDIKPSNLMLTRPHGNQPPTVKILDMGLALLEDSPVEAGEELTSTGQIMGTIDYMAPEQSTDTHTVDIRADIYSLGASLFKLLTGRAPFAGERTESVVKKLMALATQPAPDVRTFRPDCPVELALLVNRMLSKSPADRPTPPGALAELLAPFARGADLVVLMTNSQSPSSAGLSISLNNTQGSISPNTPTIITGSDQRGSKPPRGRSRVKLVGGFAAALLLGVIFITITRQDGTVTTIEVPDDAKISIATKGQSGDTASPAETLPPAAGFEVDREAARQVLAVGGTIAGVIPGLQEALLKPGQPLPDRPFYIFNVQVPAHAATTGLIDQLARLNRLVHLQLLGENPDPGLLAQLPRLPHLNHLELPATGLNGSDLAPLKQLPYLTHLRLPHDVVQRAGILTELTSLRILSIDNGNDADLELLAGSPQLRMITLVGGQASEAAVAELQAKNPQVRVLVEGNQESRSIGRDPLVEALRRLLPKGVKFRATGWPKLGAGKPRDVTLQNLDTFSTSVVRFVEIPADVELDAADLAALSDVQIFVGSFHATWQRDPTPYLEYASQQLLLSGLNIAGAKLSPSNVRQLEGLASLQELAHLTVKQTGLTREQVEKLRRTLPRARIYSDFGDFPPLADEEGGEYHPPSIQTPPSAVAVDLDRQVAEQLVSIGGSALVFFRDQAGGQGEISSASPPPDRPFEIYSLHVPASADAAQVLRIAAHLKRLQQVTFLSSAGGSVVVPELSRLSRLRRVEIQIDATLSTDDLAQLTQLPRLGWLGLHHDAVQRNAGILPEFKHVSLLEVRFGTDDDLRLLAECPNLRTIALIEGTASEQAVAELQAKNPHVRVIQQTAGTVAAVGRDPSVEALRQLLEKGVEFDVSAWPFGTNPSHLLSVQDLDEKSPLVVNGILIPRSKKLNNEDLALLDDIQCVLGCRLSSLQEPGPYLDCLRSQTMAESLPLDRSPLTAADVQKLAEMPWLRAIWMRDTGVSREQVDSLRRSLPYTRIFTDFGDFEPLADEENYESLPAPIEPSRTIAPVDHATDRAAAEWVLSHGGTVEIGYPITRIRSIEELPASGSLRLVTVSLARQSISRGDIDWLTGLSSLEFLYLRGTRVDPEVLSHVAKLPSLREVSITDTGLKSSQIIALQDLPRLSVLSFNADQIDDKGRALRGLASLRQINLRDGDSATAVEFAKIPQLRILWMTDSKDLTPGIVSQCQQLNPRLRIVVGEDQAGRVLGKDPLRDLALHLQSLGARLETWRLPSGSGRFDLNSDSTAPFAIREIKFPPKTSLAESDLAELSTCTYLYGVIADDLKQADRLVDALHDQVDLSWLQLSGCDLTDEGLKSLNRLPGLRKLDLSRTQVTRAAVEAFRKAQPKCKVLSDFGDFEPLGDESLVSPIPPASALPAVSANVSWPEMPEPPPLEEWLKGREVLTVKQDGTAMFKTIQSALDAMKDGQVVRVLDKGPYRETLTWKGKSNSGLISTVGTLIQLDQWSENDGDKPNRQGHQLLYLSGCRLSGFTFSYRRQSAQDKYPISFWRIPGFCWEDCVVVPETPESKLSGTAGIQLPLDAFAVDLPALTVRRCVFGTYVWMTASSDAPWCHVLFRQNWIREGGFMVNAQGPGSVQADLRGNVLLIPDSSAVSLQGSAPVRLRLLNNSLASEKSPLRIFNPQVAGLWIEHNLQLSGENGLTIGASVVEQMQRVLQQRENNYSQSYFVSAPGKIPLASGKTVQSFHALSDDPLNRNYLRVDPASIKIPDGDPFPGALPPGPAPADGDWFTRLQERLRNIPASPERR